jgi:hypothetical protein
MRRFFPADIAASLLFGIVVHSRQADFAVGSLGFEIGGPNKGKEQIRGDSQSFIVKDEADIPQDPQVLPLWIFGFLIG